MIEPIECPTSTNGSLSRNPAIVPATAETCSSIVNRADSRAGERPNPSRSIAMTRWFAAMSGTRNWKVTDEEAMPCSSTTGGPVPVSIATCSRAGRHQLMRRA